MWLGISCLTEEGKNYPEFALPYFLGIASGIQQDTIFMFWVLTVCTWVYLKFNSINIFQKSIIKNHELFLVLCCQNLILFSSVLRKLKHNILFFSHHEFFHLHTSSFRHWWSLESFFGFSSSFWSQTARKNIPRKESHRLAVSLTVQSSVLGLVRATIV